MTVLTQAIWMRVTDGTIYGVASDGGKYSAGVVFQLVPSGKAWTYDVIWNFKGSDGAVPVGINFNGDAGALYGTASSGGSFGFGTIFQLKFDGISWKRTVLHQFAGGSGDGAYPESRPIVAGSTLYGTTTYGGINNYGVVYSVHP